MSDEDPLAISPAAGSKRKRAVASLPESDEESFTGGGSESELTALEEEEEGDEYGFGELDPPSVKKKKNALRKGKVDAEDSPTKKTPTKRARKMAQDAATAATEGDSPVKTPRKRQARAPKPEPVYVIPDVEKLETTFKGRLGQSVDKAHVSDTHAVRRFCLFKYYFARQETCRSSCVLFSHLPVCQ